MSFNVMKPEPGKSGVVEMNMESQQGPYVSGFSQNRLS
jgi:hypothetical protein